MKRLWVIIFNILLVAMPALAWAGGGGEKATKLEQRIDLAKLSGINLFFARWYNDNLWVYATIVTAIMGIVGLVIAVGTDLLLKMIGMDVSKIEHHE